MRKNSFLAAICIFLLFSFVGARRSLVGHWKVAYGNKHTGEMVCHSNGHFEATFKGETWKVGGEYKSDGATVSISDSSCGFGYWAKYRTNWFSDDSVSFSVIEDSCSGRKSDGDGAVLVRMKK
ncbi:MAG TPA: hypothetical protein VHE34_02475 [Puia sp.]|uniref:hypothetical protein n=1 Tax=Puia sp. TaxID=2045100 RepID=UPI002C70ED97|nr:hypothetical protein [Puia sp.]HVU94053.1 hypothetical protein [Puia sp.]